MLTAGTHLGSYEIVAPLGSGGMGEVYRARDTKLNREVALKVLPESVALDPDRLARFRREAQVLASLNHPNIGAIYGFQEGNNIQALVLELVEGPTLADRIAQGPIPLEAALPLARQIAEALETAHQQGIIHRDLKPANIKLRPDGTVKVLDFGLAKAATADPLTSPASLTSSPTLTSPLNVTGVGVLLGTATYMAPEQAKGNAADRRSDIWAFGCVLFEMLAGTRAFQGNDVADTLAAIIRAEPVWATLPAATPPSIRKLLERCLQKDRTKRLTDIGMARIEIDDCRDAKDTAAPAVNREEPTRRALTLIPWGIAAVSVAGLAWGLLGRREPPAGPGPLLQVSVAAGTEAGLADAAMAVSPDGASIVFPTVGAERSGLAPEGGGALYVRRLDRLTAALLRGTEGGTYPFFSPDGQWIGFFARGRLRKVPTFGGSPVDIAGIASFRGGSWTASDMIVFAMDNGPLWQVPANGGTPVEVTTLVGAEVSHRWPEAIPGSDAVLFTAVTNLGQPDASTIATVTLTTRERGDVVRGGFAPRLVGNRLVYLNAGTLLAVPFDTQTLKSGGTPVPVADDVLSDPARGASFDATNGAIVYLKGTALRFRESAMLWLDASGTTVPLRTIPTACGNPQFSPDGRMLAIDIGSAEAGNSVWLYDLKNDALRLLTSGSGLNPVWTPDGRRVTFTNERQIFWQATDGTGDAQPLTDFGGLQIPWSWHPSGRFLAITRQGTATSFDVVILEMHGSESTGWTPGPVTPFADTPAAERFPTFSPDGRWLAYSSNESGRLEIYVRPFPSGPGGGRISDSGGTLPTWSDTHLFYMAPDRHIMAAGYASNAGAFVAQAPKQWSPTQAGDASGHGGSPRPFASHPDGRFLVSPMLERKPLDHINLLLGDLDRLTAAVANPHGQESR